MLATIATVVASNEIAKLSADSMSESACVGSENLMCACMSVVCVCVLEHTECCTLG